MKSRSKEYKWDLTSIDNTVEIDNLIETYKEDIEHFCKKFKGRMSLLEAEELACAVKEMESLSEKVMMPQIAAQLLFALDSTNPENQIRYQKMMEFGNLASRELLFFEHEIICAKDDHFSSVIESRLLSDLQHYLKSLRKFRDHTLPENEEKLLKFKSLTGSDAFCRLFDELSSSYSFRFSVDGEEKDVTGEELISMLHHKDEKTREGAFSLFLSRHGDDSITYTSIINNIALDYSQERVLRNYGESPLTPTNLGNELDDSAVENLMSVTEDHYPLAQRYFRLKKKILNIDDFKNTDLYAPVFENASRYSLNESIKLVTESYHSFSPDLSRMVKDFFSKGRIDSHPAKGKSGGAFCMGISPSHSPFILLNFTGNLRDISTIAHETGHGIHFELARKQRLVNYHPPLPLAETASVFGEMLLIDHLLGKSAEKSLKASILCASIEDIIATTFRQVLLTRFEEKLHTERAAGLVTTDRICSLWLDENARLFGNDVRMIEPYRWGWSYISHFIHSRFYCYSYTFAELAVLSLFRKYKDEGEKFVPKYLSILESGGSLSPSDALSIAGININDREIWKSGYKILEKFIDDLEAFI